MPTPPAPSPRLVIFDLDGVVYRGSEPVPGAAELVAALRGAGLAVRFATNNSMATRGAYADRLAGQAITAVPDEIVTSTWATITHLRRHEPALRRLLALGAAGMLDELRGAGYEATHAGDAAGPGWNGEPLAVSYDAVVAGLDPEVTYRTLGIAAAAIRGGVRFVATNADLRYPTPGGLLPGAGTIVAALQATTGRPPLVIGKPEPAMFRAILEADGIVPEAALVIGDNPDADVPAARRAGIPVILVLTGVTDAAAAARLSGERRPDWVAAGPAEVAALLGVSLS
ncbi:MAG TPA: HAD-IIA family hydrolase [Candidatus Limnocylindria bacterium]|nr:HAD-IIA family hydrolase [Candidatus Limnocylindria bacterium]